MRKIVSVVLAIVMILSLGLSSAVAQATEAGTGVVKAGYVAGTTAGQIVSVDIAWEGMEFTYNGASEGVWDPENHTYGEATEAAWAESNAHIAITNHSNVILQAAVDYSSNTGFEEMELAFTDRFPFIGSAETSDGEGEECEVIIRAIPVGMLKPDTPSGTNVGEIKVTVSPVDDPSIVFDSLGELCGDVPVKTDGTIPRGGIYFETAADKSDMLSYYSKAGEIVSAEGTSTADKNLALNAWLTAYYNKLHLMQ